MSEIPFWSEPLADAFARLKSSDSGLTQAEAERRFAERPRARRDASPFVRSLLLFLAQFKSPIVLILIAAAALSVFLKDGANASIILAIVLASSLLGFWQERGAADAVQKLLAVVQVKATCLRDGQPAEVPTDSVVPGDILLFGAGNLIPADGRILDSVALSVNEAALTGETYPVEKLAGALPPETPLAKRSNALFLGTSVVSGTARMLAVGTGRDTEFGKVAQSLSRKPPETEFERGIRRFGYLLMEVTMALVLSVFAANVYFHRPVVDALLFSLALAVGLTPQLLPAIVSVNLAHGARRMAERKVIVRRLAAIENFGSMDVLCMDKTGTLTEGAVRVRSAEDVRGAPSERVFRTAYLNASFQSGYANPIDDAIRAYRPLDVSDYEKRGEAPYDFQRKRLSVLVGEGERRYVVTKGALNNVLEVCDRAELSDGTVVPLDSVRAAIQARYEALSLEGARTLGIATRELPGGAATVAIRDEREMTFVGFVTLFDPLQSGVKESLQNLRDLGIGLKIITGDNALVAATVGKQAGIADPKVLTGGELRRMSTVALARRAPSIDLFAEVEPNQKESIVLALQKSGRVVGYLGDGINDASALHAADVGISVASAVDVAKEAADIVLLEKSLDVLAQGVREGRVTFANTLKYVFMATSANFGNMFSMAGASLFLSFLPLLPKQILLTNLLTDFPEMTIATDRVDPESVDRPHRWNLPFVRRFMIVFGLVSSICDYLTFGALLFFLHANTRQFRTGWFTESVISASLIVLVIRTRKPFWRSRPGRPLALATLAVAGVVLALPYTPLASPLGLEPLPGVYLFALAAILAFYVLASELAKSLFYRSQTP